MTYFQKFSTKTFRFWSKMADFTIFKIKKRKKICQNRKFGPVRPVKQGFFPLCGRVEFSFTGEAASMVDVREVTSQF